MKRITKLTIVQILLACVVGVLLGICHPEWTLKDLVLPMVVLACGMVVGYIDRMIDEEKEK